MSNNKQRGCISSIILLPFIIIKWGVILLYNLLKLIYKSLKYIIIIVIDFIKNKSSKTNSFDYDYINYDNYSEFEDSSPEINLDFTLNTGFSSTEISTTETEISTPITIFDKYEVINATPPIEIENGLINYIASEEENIFTEKLAEAILNEIPNAMIELSLRSHSIINYHINGCQICRFQYNRHGSALQVLHSDFVNWIYINNLNEALTYIPDIVDYASHLSHYHSHFQFDDNSKITHTYVYLYFNCCYSIFQSDEKRERYLSNTSDQLQYFKYRERLGADCPKTLKDFLNIKYNFPEDWECLKSMYRKNKKTIPTER